MIKIINHESKRFYKMFLVIMGVYFTLLLLNITNHSEQIYKLEASSILLLTIGVASYIAISFGYDDFTNNKLLYMKSDVTSIKLIVSRLVVVLLFTLVALILSTIVFNVKVLIYKEYDQLEYIRMNLDYVGLLLVDKTLKEWFYPVNFVINIIYNTLLLFVFLEYYRSNSNSMKKTNSFILTLVALSIVNMVVFKFVEVINKKLVMLDLNYLEVRRIKALQFASGEINFLSISSVIIYGAISIWLVYLLSRRKAGDRL